MKHSICHICSVLCLCAVISALLITLSACNTKKDDLICSLDAPLEAELLFTVSEISYRTRVSLGSVEDSDGTRDAQIEFLSPATVKGMRAERMGGVAFVTFGEMRTAYTESGTLFLSAELLAPAHITRKTRMTENGRTVFSMLCTDGRRIYVDAETGEIQRIEEKRENGETVTAEVIWCEIKQ